MKWKANFNFQQKGVKMKWNSNARVLTLNKKKENVPETQGRLIQGLQLIFIPLQAYLI